MTTSSSASRCKSEWISEANVNAPTGDTTDANEGLTFGDSHSRLYESGGWLQSS
jgi:hypothetical protein